MSRGLNKVMLIGNLGSDPELRYTPSGKPVTTFTVATSRAYTAPDGERREVTEWFGVVAWRRLAEICCQHLARGSRVYIEGRLQTRYWEDSEGRRQQRVEVVASEMIVLDGGSRHDVPHDYTAADRYASDRDVLEDEHDVHDVHDEEH